MSKPVKELIRKEIMHRLEGVTSMAVVGFSKVDAISNNEIRGRLREKDIRMTVVKNSLARQAFREMGIEGAGPLLEGPCAVAWGADSVVTVVRELLDIKKQQPNLTVKAAYMEGAAFGPERIDELSKYPTRDEAIAKLVTCILSPGSNLGGCLKSPAAKIAGILKTIEENHGEGAEAGEPAAAEA